MAKRSSSRSGSDDPKQKRRPHPRALARRRAARRQQALGGSDRQTRALSGAVRSSPRLTVPLSSWKQVRRSRGPRRARSFHSAMAPGRVDTPASGRLLAATLQAFDGDGYRSQVDAALSARVYALIADLPRTRRLARHLSGARSRWRAAVRAFAGERLPVLRASSLVARPCRCLAPNARSE